VFDCDDALAGVSELLKCPEGQVPEKGKEKEKKNTGRETGSVIWSQQVEKEAGRLLDALRP
jgi:hypothetical protein